MKFVQNEPIAIIDMKELHKIVKSATLIGFLNQLAVLNDLTENKGQPLTQMLIFIMQLRRCSL